MSLAQADTLALLMKALEDESERAGVTNDASRQLLFASGLLPRGVAVPEWLQFGMGSFFETPEHSPWPTPAGPSTLYLPAFREELKGKKFEGDPYKTLRKIVTDGYFHELTPDDLKNKSAAQTRARTGAWSLTYFLAERKLDNLQRYFKVLGEMPRDLDLDEATLWEAFARAFDAYDPKTKRFDDAKLGNLAAQWQDYVSNEHMEAEELVSALEKTLSDLKEEKGGRGQASPAVRFLEGGTYQPEAPSKGCDKPLLGGCRLVEFLHGTSCPRTTTKKSWPTSTASGTGNANATWSTGATVGGTFPARRRAW